MVGTALYSATQVHQHSSIDKSQTHIYNQNESNFHSPNWFNVSQMHTLRGCQLTHFANMTMFKIT